MEVWIVPAHGEQELRLLEPHEVGKATGKLAVGTDEPGVIGKLRLDGEQAFGRAEACFEGQLDFDQRCIVRGQGHARHAEDANLNAAVECNVEHADEG